MEKLPKIAICVGIGISTTIFVLIVISMMPHVIDVMNDYWDISYEQIDKEAYLEKFYSTESYLVFIEKYPVYGESQRIFDDRGEIRLTAMNFTSLTKIELELNYNSRDDYFRQNIDCRNDQNDWRLRIDGPLTAQFLENIDCLAMGTFTGKSSELVVYADMVGGPDPTSWSFIAD